ncbi:MAG: Ig-like domain-containing protein, partial [Gemmatimonadota bacterium]|nr:Ig-like domain-containing protein [Gemmatimonadota bacterium]
MRRRTALAVAAICVACAEAGGPARLREGQLAIAPVVASTPIAIVDIAAVRIRLTRVGGTSPFIDTTVTVSPDQTEFDLQLTVLMTSESEPILLSLVLLDPAGIEVYRDEGNPTTVTVSASSDRGPITVPIEYIGAGASAVRLEILGDIVLMYSGEIVLLDAVAYDALDQVIADAPVGWMALDPFVSFDDPTSGLVRAGPLAGTARVIAMLPRVRESAPLITDTATVTVRINQPPDNVSIVSPTQGASFTAGNDIVFSGSANDPEDGALTGSQLRWESSLDGVIGSGTSFSRNDLTVGSQLITLLATDNQNATSSASVTISVTEQLTITTISLNAGTVGESYSAQLDAQGGTAAYVWSLTGGTLPDGLDLAADGSITGVPTAAGTEAFTVQVASGEETATADLTITTNRAATSTSITSDDPDPSAVGQGVLVTYTVTSTGGTPTGDVTVSDGVDSCVGTVADGSCSLALTTVGDRTLTATYAGDANFAGSADTEPHVVAQLTTTTTVTSDDPDPSTVGQNVVVTYTVTSTGGTPTGDVTVTDGVDSCTGTVGAGSCTLALTTAGDRTLTATYAGNVTFAGSADTEPHTVAQATTVTSITSDTPDPSAVGEAVTVDYTVTSTGGTPTGDVTVSDGVDSCTGTVAGGSCTLGLTTVGDRTLTAAYAGDANFGASSDTESHTVTQATTTTAITSDDPDPSAVGQDVVVTYTVTSTG